MDTNKNKDIKNNTETMGFLAIITDKPDNKNNTSIVFTTVNNNWFTSP
jgi:hypothetical protein